MNVFQKINAARKEWRTRSPRAHDLTMAVLAGMLVGALWLGIGLRVFAASFTVDCGADRVPTFTAGTNTVACTPTGTTPPVTPPTPPPVTTACTSADEQIAHKWGGGNQRVVSQNFSNNVLSIKFTIPAGTTFAGGKQISVVEYQDGQATREFALSKVPCSFEPADAYWTGDNKYPAIQKGQVSPGLNYGLRGNQVYVVTPGVPVYVNVRNRDASGARTCNGGSTCNVAVTIRD